MYDYKFIKDLNNPNKFSIHINYTGNFINRPKLTLKLNSTLINQNISKTRFVVSHKESVSIRLLEYYG